MTHKAVFKQCGNMTVCHEVSIHTLIVEQLSILDQSSENSVILFSFGNTYAASSRESNHSTRVLVLEGKPLNSARL